MSSVKEVGRRSIVVITAFAGLFALLISLAILTFLSAPTGIQSQTHFDTIIVLGSPADPDGGPSPEERARVLGAVTEYKRGRAAHLIMTGGAAHNQFVEADVMARIAVSDGVPAAAVLIEPKAHNTVENIWYCHQIMQARGWHSAEVVSDAAHVHRAGLILSHYHDLEWQTHRAPWPDSYTTATIAGHWFYEILAYNRVWWGGFPAHEQIFLPR